MRCAEIRSALDTDGHRTHTASIAMGRHVFPAFMLGYARSVQGVLGGEREMCPWAISKYFGD
jgi:hypothetical protein